MIKKILPVISLLLLLHTQNALAHGGDHGPVTGSAAMAVALDAAGQFSDFDSGISIGKLAESWKSLSAESTKIHLQGDGYRIISVENKIEDKTLYILMSISGDIYDANFTGNFPKVN